MVQRGKGRILFADWSLPDDVFDSFESPDWDDEEYEQWEDFRQEAAEHLPHRMLTYPDAPQFSPFIIAANGSQGRGDDALAALHGEDVSTEGWELLLQLDTSDFFLGLHDLGWFYFLIHRDDLQKADFSRVWFNDQST